MGPSRSVDFFERVVSDEGRAKPQTMADATALVGAEVDTQPQGHEGYRSLEATFQIAFTTASGDSTGKNTVLVEVYEDDVTGMGTETLLKSDTYVYTWAADGANDGVHILPVSLETAKRFVRAKATITESGTVTTSAWVGAITCSLGGMVVNPDSAYADAGYEATTEPTA